jgi:hypothetical protein
MYTEAFYWFAFRTLCAAEELPDFGKKFKTKAKGVTYVRNNLVEHPFGKNGIRFGGHKIGQPEGPILKFVWSFEEENNRHPDKGLFVNAKEFYEKLTSHCQECSKRLRAKGAVIIRRADPANIPKL